LMLHACFTPIALCFVYTSLHFYAFSGTNLLMRCHSASSYFLLFLCFRKVTQEIFLKLDETKAKVPIYLKGRQSPKGRQSRTRRWLHHRVARATLGRNTRWCGPLVHPLTSPFRLQILVGGKTLRKRTLFHETYCKLFPAPCRRGESSPEAFFITMPASGVMRE
jgi:hypothetical protein